MKNKENKFKLQKFEVARLFNLHTIKGGSADAPINDGVTLTNGGGGGTHTDKTNKTISIMPGK